MTDSLVPVRQNHWRDAAVPLPADWTPHRTVSVVIPAYNPGPVLDLTLASLAAQDYPQDLFDVVVVDDGGNDAYELPAIRPTRTRLVRPETGWGRANACHTGATSSAGEIIVWLDSDMVVPRDHITAHVSWYDRVADVVTKGDITFVDDWAVSPAEVFDATRADELATLFPTQDDALQWVEKVYEETDDLNTDRANVFTIYTGASASVSREMYDAAGGMDTSLRLGEDSELAYRLAQQGAVFIPARNAPCFHLGRTTTQVRDEQVRHHDSPYFAQRAPLIGGRRTTSGRIWSVPKVRAVVSVDTSTARLARSTVDRLLCGLEEDIHVDLVGPWSTLHDERRRVLDDPTTELYLLREWFTSEPRVSLVEEAPATVTPTPFLLEVPVVAGFNIVSLHRLLHMVERRRLGALRVPLESPSGPVSVDLWRVSALNRVRRHHPGGGLAGRELQKAVDEVWGVWWGTPKEFKIFNLSTRSTFPEKLIRSRGAERKALELRREAAKTAKLRKELLAIERKLAKAGPRPGVKGALKDLRQDVRRLAKAVVRRLR